MILIHVGEGLDFYYLIYNATLSNNGSGQLTIRTQNNFKTGKGQEEQHNLKENLKIKIKHLILVLLGQIAKSCNTSEGWQGLGSGEPHEGGSSRAEK